MKPDTLAQLYHFAGVQADAYVTLSQRIRYWEGLDVARAERAKAKMALLQPLVRRTQRLINSYPTTGIFRTVLFRFRILKLFFTMARAKIDIRDDTPDLSYLLQD